MTTTAPDTATRSTSLWREGLIVGVIAVVANVAIWAIASAFGVSFDVTMGGTSSSVTVVQPIASTVVGVLMAVLSLWVLRRFSRGVTIWTVLATVAFLLSLLQPIAAGDDTGTVIALLLMHVVVYVLAILRLRPAALRS